MFERVLVGHCFDVDAPIAEIVPEFPSDVDGIISWHVHVYINLRCKYFMMSFKLASRLHAMQSKPAPSLFYILG